MNVLVTGGAGFIGCHLVRRLLRESGIRRLVNLDCLTYAGHLANLDGVADDPRYVFEQADLRDFEAVRRVVRQHAIDQVCHLAAESHVDRSIAAPGDFIHTNVLGTFHLLEACRAAWPAGASGRRFLYVSTDEVYGTLGPEGVFTEASPLAARSPYSASKAAGDLLTGAYRATYGLPVVVTHCSNNYGPFQFPEKLIPVVIRSIVGQRSIPVYGDGLQVRDWLHVEDHVEGLWLALTRAADGAICNLGGENEWTNLRLVERLCDLVDAARPELGGNSRRLITRVEDRPGHDRRYAISTAKARRELGWAPRWDFAHGLADTVRWYLEHDGWCAEVLREAAARRARPA